MKEFQRIAIANRGEVAVRIIRACQELGIQTVLLHSEPDSQSLAHRLSDHQVCIGSAPPNESYLNIQNNIRGAQAGGAQAVHPGFGFLSENAEFALACREANLTFIGPDAGAIKLFGDKIEAKKIAEEMKIKTVPGYKGDNQDINFLIEQCEKMGYPVLVKATAGGGGRGLKVIQSKADVREKIESAKREANSSFGSDKVFLEKYLDRAKHIEVQVFGDALGKIHILCERECTVQRRHQKIIEEAPSASLTEKERQILCELARKIAEKGAYKNAGTIEFLFQDGDFYFIEMNTRLQVEHAVTELILNLDLVKAQILTAQGMPLNWSRTELSARGHAIECRIYAEDSYSQGMPSTGRLGDMELPNGPGRRFEFGFETGDTITHYYDPMIGKIIVWDENRPQCIKKAIEVLSQTVIFGVKTNIPFLKAILAHPDFVSTTMTTQFIGKYFPNGLEQKSLTNDQRKFAAFAYDHCTLAHSNDQIVLPNPWRQDWRV
ncbi:MAG: biotin carboxylase N-terminal domain-containing protein [Pseudomonadota bacterium]|nr:biotin carboxylase N-terminal domain-containing protein [Pseudomonadota bacterium]